jgi:ferritin-like protein
MATDEPELHSMFDLTLGELDCDGAVQEAVEQVTGETRAAFIGKAVVGGAALFGALAAPAVAEASAASDVAILNYALTLEYLQAAFYTETERLGAVGGELKRVPRQLGAVERAHVTAIKQALGRAAVKRPAFNFRGVTEDNSKFLKTAVAFEDLAAAAYKAQAARIKSPALLAAAISIHSVEARHAAWMRFLAGVTPAAAAFDEGKPISEVRQIVASTHFVVARPKRKAKKNPKYTG